MPSPIFALCDYYIWRYGELDPVTATAWGLPEATGATDYSPDGNAARAELAREVLRQLDTLAPAAVSSGGATAGGGAESPDPAPGAADRLAADHLRERLTAHLAWHDTGESLRYLRAPYGLLQWLRNHVDLMPRSTLEQRQALVDRVAAVPRMLATWQESLRAGAAQGLVAARRQAVEAAAQARQYAGAASFQRLADGAPAGTPDALVSAAAAADAAYAQVAAWLEGEYAPRAASADGVGPERYAVASRLSLGDTIDPYDAYDWGWEELRRLEEELVAEAGKILPGAGVDEAIVHLDRTDPLVGVDAYRAWLRDKHAEAIEQLHGVHFDIPEPLRTVDVVTQDTSSAGSAYYTPPSEDLRRPGRTWWPVGGRETFAVWAELTTVFHEGVPGHHLQLGQLRAVGERLSRFSRLSNVSGHGEGWALYAERLADELGWHEAAAAAGTPGTRLGMLKGSALRAARVVIDIGLHLDLPLPPAEAGRHGPRWSFEVATEVLRDRGRIAAHRLHPEVVRYCGWPGQATSYKLGERAWLAARAEARDRLGPRFDLKQWHTAALSLGPVGLGTLATALRSVGSMDA